MRKDGIGGAKTVTGLHFENKVNLLTRITNIPGYEIKDNQIYFNGKCIAYSYAKNALYKSFLEPKGVNYQDFNSKKYLPDEAIYIPELNTIYIIEMKFQFVGGSVDEKLQTCDFKRKIYLKLMSSLRINVEYAYILSDYFDKPKFNDTFRYIKEVGCDYFLNELPLAWLNFPQPILPKEQPIPQDVTVTN